MLRSRMSRVPVSKELWKQLEPLMPPFAPSRKGGRRKRTISDDGCPQCILYVLQTGIPWEDLPQALGYASGMTFWRRLRDWNDAGLWEQLHHAMLVHLRAHLIAKDLFFYLLDSGKHRTFQNKEESSHVNCTHHA
jgi:transposase